MPVKFDIHQPCAALKPYIKQLIISENNDAETYKVLPGTSLVMGFQYSGRLAYRDDNIDHALATAGVTGLMDAYRIFTNEARTGTVLVFFHETGAARFFPGPVHELFGKSLSLEHFFGATLLKQTEELLAGAIGDTERIKIIEDLLLSQLHDVSVDLLVDKALQYIHRSKGTIRITELAKKLNTSQSPLEKRFRRVVGASPKKFASIVRVKNVIASLDQDEQDHAAFLAGYYDQAHFIRNFKTFTSVTPEQYLRDIKASREGK